MLTMKSLNIFFILLFSVSCSTGIESSRKQNNYDLKADVDLFLSTSDSDIEVKTLKRLKDQKVSHTAVKNLLRQRARPIEGKRGLLTGLKFKTQGKNVSSYFQDVLIACGKQMRLSDIQVKRATAMCIFEVQHHHFF